METKTQNTESLGLSWNENPTDLKIYTHGRLSVVQNDSNLSITHGNLPPNSNQHINVGFYNLWTLERYDSYQLEGTYKGDVMPTSFPIRTGADKGLAILGAWDTNHLLYETDFDLKTNKEKPSGRIEGSKTNFQPDTATVGENNFCAWVSPENELYLSAFKINTTRDWSTPIAVPIDPVICPTDSPGICKLDEDNLLIFWSHNTEIYHCIYQLSNENTPFSEPKIAPFRSAKPMSAIHLYDGKGIAAMTGETEHTMARTCEFTFNPNDRKIDWSGVEAVSVSEFTPAYTPTLFLRGDSLLMFAVCKEHKSKVISATGKF